MNIKGWEISVLISKRDQKYYFVKTDIKNNRSQVLLEHNSALGGNSRTGSHIILNEGCLRPFKIHKKMKRLLNFSLKWWNV